MGSSAVAVRVQAYSPGPPLRYPLTSSDNEINTSRVRRIGKCNRSMDIIDLLHAT